MSRTKKIVLLLIQKFFDNRKYNIYRRYTNDYNRAIEQMAGYSKKL